MEKTIGERAKDFKEYVIDESDCKWWWFWLHPGEAFIMSHFGCIHCDEYTYKSLTKYGYKNSQK